ncbi:MAG: 50S ribosomal protein L11 methyltransferase [Acidobacteria bacterium]|nr:50S ribosomal protein L11 methyltransferase [Acidobacteriota bacterium]
MRTWPALEVSRPDSPDRLDLLQATFLDYRIAAIDDTNQDGLQVYFNTPEERDRAAADLGQQYPDLALTPIDVPDEDWVARSQASLRAVRVGNIIIAPPWDIPHTGKLKLDAAADSGGTPLRRPVVIVIRPSMGFGTAHHATTRLCLASLQHVDVRGQSALDVGTGSGVLAIAASRLGATSTMGIDDDPDALHAAEENLLLNRAADVTFRVNDVRDMTPGTFDLVTANLTGALLVETSSRLRDLTAPGGQLILSGFMHEEEEAVVAAYSDCTVGTRSEEDGWVCVGLRHP